MTASELTPSRWTSRRVVRAAIITGLAFGVGAAAGRLLPRDDAPRAAPVATAVDHAGDGATPPPPSRSLSSAERAILSPLREGSSLAGFHVVEMSRTSDDRALYLVCQRQGIAVRLDVTLALDGGPPPPAVGGPYAVFYTRQTGSPEDAEHLATELANVLRSNAALPIPEKLAPFAPEPP